MARKETAEKNLSAKAVRMAEQDGDWLYYDENTKDIPMFEVLQRKMAACKRVETAVMEQMEEIKRNGRLNLTDYFGECNPPMETPQGGVVDRLHIRNGIYFTQDDHEMKFAVHEAVADNFMSPIATEFGQKQGEYLFYDMTASAIPLNELKNVFDETEALIVSEDSLYATLKNRFEGYTVEYNACMPEEYRIPEVNAPDSLFLAVQLEQVKDMEKQEVSPAITAEEEYGEQVDYGVDALKRGICCVACHDSLSDWLCGRGQNRKLLLHEPLPAIVDETEPSKHSGRVRPRRRTASLWWCIAA